MLPTARTTSRRYGAAVMYCANLARTRRESPPDSSVTPERDVSAWHLPMVPAVSNTSAVGAAVLSRCRLSRKVVDKLMRAGDDSASQSESQVGWNFRKGHGETGSRPQAGTAT